MKPLYPLLALFILFTLLATAQQKTTGPIIKDYGAVWGIDSLDYKVNSVGEFKVVFDIMNSPDAPSALNRRIETAARFLNMHAQNGVANEQMKVALVVHNIASKDLMNNESYHKKYGIDNPNADMIAQLMDADVEFIFCGQSSMARNITKEELIEGVQLSLSAMTALIQLQNQGYRLIKF